jgi:hypothetical protein
MQVWPTQMYPESNQSLKGRAPFAVADAQPNSCGSSNEAPDGQELESDETVQARVLGLVHHTHTASAKFLDDAVVRDDPHAAPVRKTYIWEDNSRVVSSSSQLRAISP